MPKMNEYIAINGKSIDLDALKENTIKKPVNFEESSLFNVYDKDKNGILDKKELRDFSNDVKKAAGNSVFSNKEVQQFAKDKKLEESDIAEKMTKFLEDNSKSNSSQKDKLLPKHLADELSGYPSTEAVGKVVARIDESNVIELIDDYKKNNKSLFSQENRKSLAEDILSNYNIPTEDRIEYINHIAMAIDNKAKQRNNKASLEDLKNSINEEVNYQANKFGPMNSKSVDRLLVNMLNRSDMKKYERNAETDGVVSDNFSQGMVDDCWLLASIISLKNSPKGEKLLKETVKKDENGFVSVNLKGVGKKYIFSEDEINQKKEYSTGDGDVRAIEMAIEKYMKESDRSTVEEGNFPSSALTMLVGKNNSSLNGFLKSLFLTDDTIEKFKDKNTICIASFRSESKEKVAYDNKGRKVDLVAHHAYSITGADDKNVYLHNPWDAKEELSMPHESFKNVFKTTSGGGVYLMQL